MTSINTLISKWILEDRLTDQDLGTQVRKFYWTNLHEREHWIWQDDEDELWWDGYGDHGGSRDDDDEIY